ncbi:TauD/TfdA family dioxygenase [Sneathiella sp. CAU 1612]|uniref:TauD/TfdA family dioxygenase n=1 Tax=Sneathiella sedimenti TaxID=2816034 RepID=A0ABS3F7N2_9PROT|nr:TauD/TfdA family dioxygenase [Sneathiella sedimenti]MBO0334533.1 TauD/TfdA family dioxygenase [Sneathiella sedimenti]
MITVTRIDAPCGARVEGVDLSAPLNKEDVAAIRKAWMDHHVLVFPEQKLENDDLVKFAEYLGPIGDDPFFHPIDGHDKIAAVHRYAHETGRIFADNWHSDWSFMTVPPSGTMLYGLIIPTEGGDTLFSNQHLAWEEMPPEMKDRFENLTAVHSAGGAYSREGAYSEKNFKGAMRFNISDEANKRETHPVIRNHPETGKKGIFGGGYLVDLDGMDHDSAKMRLKELYSWQGREEFIYRHKWEPDMLVLWDNRSVLHCATGGYEGQERLLHRLTIADNPAYY